MTLKRVLLRISLTCSWKDSSNTATTLTGFSLDSLIKRKENVLLLKYEWMKSHPEESIKNIGSFIHFRNRLDSSPGFLSHVISGSSVKIMKEVMNPSSRSLYLNKENGDLEHKGETLTS